MSLASRLSKLEAARPPWRDTQLALDTLSLRACAMLADAYGASLKSDHPDVFLETLRANVGAAQGNGVLDLSQLSSCELMALVALWEDMAL